MQRITKLGKITRFHKLGLGVVWSMTSLLSIPLLSFSAVPAMAKDGGTYAISTVNPISGPPGTVVTIAGSGIALNTTTVKFNGVSATWTGVGAPFIKAVVPVGATTGPIVISGSGGTATSLMNFTVTSSGGNTPPPPSVINPPPHINPPAGALTSHPRLWIRGNDVQRFRNWAVPNNQIWNDLQSVALLMKTHVAQGKVPQLDSGDGEISAYAYPTEEYAETFALMSLVDPSSAANRANWAQMAHDLLMVIMNNAVLGPAANQPFRTPHFATFNRSRWFGEAFPLVVDWCYQTFTAAEKATIRKVFIRWCQECQDPNVAGGGYTPSPVGVTNSTTLINSKTQVRWAGNNYWCNHARNIGMMSLALDAADDVPTVAGDPPSGYLHDYIGNAIGTWLYIRNFAENNDLRGGLSPEGTAYSESSYSAIAMLLLALHSAGYDDVATYGSGAGVANNAFWKNDVMDAYIHSLSPQTTQFASWMPPMYLPASYGDVLRYESIDMVRQFAPLAMMDIMDGNTNSARVNKIKWILNTLSPGGMSSLDSRLLSSWTNYYTMLPILYFLTYDPTVPAPVDPRASMPVDYVSQGNNRILSRTDWSTNASWFSFISTWDSIDHQWGDSNSFSFYRKGEWLSKEWSGYGKNISTPGYQNNLSLENLPSGASMPSYVFDQGNLGGQYSYVNDGDPTVVTSVQGTYAYAQGDVTKRYNTTAYQATGVLHASRSILYLKPDVVVVYDRATSKSVNKYKRFFLNFATSPVITGNVATINTTGGQKLFVSSVLPSTATLTWDMPTTTWGYNEVANNEPMKYRLKIEDTQNPQDIRFLNVLQGADGSALTPMPLQSIQSMSGSAYDGVTVGSVVVMFAKDLSQPFAGLTYTAPTGTTLNYVTGLTPGASYSVNFMTGVTGTVVTVTAGGSTVADSGGVIRF